MIPGKRTGGSSTKGGVGETDASAGGELTAKVVYGHARTRSQLADNGRTLRNRSGRGYSLRRIPHDEARVRTVGSGRGACVADVGGGKGLYFQFPFWENTTGIFPSGSGKRKHRLLQNLRCGRYDRASTVGFRFPVRERPRKRRQK